MSSVERPRRRVLISAYSCEPGQGSEPEVGWRWVEAAARVADVVVLVRDDHLAPIHDHERQHGADPAITWIPVKGPFAMGGRNSRGLLVQFHYLLWQWWALLEARRQIAARRVDLVHHVTYVTFIYPSLLWLCKRPFVFGPVAGADAVPAAMRGLLSPRARLRERIKWVRDRVMTATPVTRWALRRASRVIAANRDNAVYLRRRFGVQAVVRPALVLEQSSVPDPVPPEGVARLLYVGALLEWKGLAVVLDALARCRSRGLDAELEICGRGPDGPRLRALARRLGVAGAVHWCGHLPRNELAERYRRATALCFPSLRDSGGFVILEAMAAGCPVLCLDHGGGGVLVEGTGAGVRLPPGPPDAVADGLAAAIEAAVHGGFEPAAARASAERFSVEALTRFLDRLYDEVSEPLPVPEPQPARRRLPDPEPVLHHGSR